MDGVRRRVASLAALGGAVGAFAIDALYLNLIREQGYVLSVGRVAFASLWIGLAATLGFIGAFSPAPIRRAWLLGWSAAMLLALSVPTGFTIGIPLLICGVAVGIGAFRAFDEVRPPRWVGIAAPFGLLVVAGVALIVGFLLTGA